jgi:hypothetical protein
MKKVERPWTLKELGLVGQDESSALSPVLMKLSHNKAAGPDGLLDIHIHNNQHVRDHVFNQILDIFNGDIQFPSYLSKSRLMLLVKDRGKGQTLDNLRPIAIQSVVRKLIEATLLYLIKTTIWDNISTS